MKNKKGVTLLEVIVAIVILGIAIVSTIQIMATNNKLVIKNERGINSIQEIESIMEVFSSNPEQFKQNISSIYGIEEDDVIKLYYTSAFIKTNNNEQSNYYLEVIYEKEDLENTKYKYTLTINTYYDNEFYTHGNSTYNKRVIIK